MSLSSQLRTKVSKEGVKDYVKSLIMKACENYNPLLRHPVEVFTYDEKESSQWVFIVCEELIAEKWEGFNLYWERSSSPYGRLLIVPY